jgi:predicted molibdopterin-dependent oxidoreductase YjgC
MEKKKTFCAFCSLECDLAVRMPEISPYFSKASIMEQDFDLDSVSQGSICAKGNFTSDYINHPKRLGYAERRHNVISTEEAFDRIKASISQVQSKHGKDSVGIIAGGNVSREEISWVRKLATDGLKTDNFGFFLPDDGMVAAGLLANGYGFKRPSLDDLQKADNILIVGDAFYEHPVIAKKVLQARYEDRRHTLVVIDPRYSNTAWFADVHLQCKPGAEGLVLMAIASLTIKEKKGDFEKLVSKLDIKDIAQKAGVSVEAIQRASDIVNGSENLAVVISDIFGKIGSPDVCSVYCGVIANGDPQKRHFYPIFIHQSVVPITALRSENGFSGAARILEEVVKGKIKGLIVLGVDLLASFPSPDMEKALKNLEFFCCSDTFHSETNGLTDILLPAANPIENKGTWSDLDGKNNEREQLLKPPAAGMTDAEILKNLYKHILPSGNGFEPESFEDITEIRAVDSYKKAALESAQKLLAFKDISGKQFPFVLITKAIASHWADGSLTRRFIWNKEHCAEPVAEIHPNAAEKLGIKDGQKITITSESGKIKLPVLLTHRIREDMVAIDYHWPEVRKLFSLRVSKGSGELINEPIAVSISK